MVFLVNSFNDKTFFFFVVGGYSGQAGYYGQYGAAAPPVTGNPMINPAWATYKDASGREVNSK